MKYNSIATIVCPDLYAIVRIDVHGRQAPVIQGTNDPPGVLKIESDETVAAAGANNVPVEHVVFNDEGHGFVKNEKPD